MKEFEELYKEFEKNSDVLDAEKEVMKERKKSKRISFLLCVIIDIIIVEILNKRIGFSNFTFVYYIISIYIIDVLIFFIMAFIFTKKEKNYKPLFKEQIIKKMLNNFFTDLEYYPNRRLSALIYLEGNYEMYDDYYSEDYIEAKIDEKYNVNMAEVHTEKEETYVDSDGNSHTSRETVFHGIFAKIVIDKSINSNLRITYNNSGYKNKLEMDSSEFEKNFDVFSSNKIIGMQLLTADVMEEILEFKEKNKKKGFFDIYIKENIIFLRFNCNSVFEPVLSKNENKKEEGLKNYYDILKFIYEISNKIIKTIHDTEI